MQKAVDSLSEAVANSKDEEFVSSLNESQHRLIISGVLQNFEFTYEITFKMIKRQLEESLANPAQVDQYNFKDLVRTAAEKGLLRDPVLWFDFREQRNITSHTYDAAKAASVYETAVQFLDEARFVLNELVKRNV